MNSNTNKQLLIEGGGETKKPRIIILRFEYLVFCERKVLEIQMNRFIDSLKVFTFTFRIGVFSFTMY